MQLNAASDYALKAMVYLATQDGVTNTSEISQEMKIPTAFLYNILGKLRKAGLIEASRGVKGGWRLLKDPTEISVYDILSTSEDTMLLDRTLAGKAPKTKAERKKEPFYDLFTAIQKEFEKNLRAHSLADVLKYFEKAIS
ncbi:MAG: Rrf2 family transcriptional regulator [Solobacterium sp.]|nr:Rrf2 family transcriptional regulator [Solobacterium sp.]